MSDLYIKPNSYVTERKPAQWQIASTSEDLSLMENT